MTPSDDTEPTPQPPDRPAPALTDDDAILITDLAPRHDVGGGSGKLRLGEQPTDDGPASRSR